MKLASFNVENLFQRARAFGGTAAGTQAVKDHAAINVLLAKPVYSAANKKRIIALLAALGIDKKDDAGEFAILRQNRGDLVSRPKNKPVQVVANGRGDWIGWVDLVVEDVNEVATRNTARVIRDLNADVLAVVEAESRPGLLHFSDHVLPAVGAARYPHAMLIDGNDDRGIDVGLFTRAGFDLVSMVSHVDDRDAQGEVFSRDCPEYTIRTPAGNTFVLLVNHFKSQGYGGGDAKRLRQSTRVAQIYQGLVAAGQTRVAVVGDLNESPASPTLAPLLATNLQDITAHPAFVADGFPGTFGNGKADDKLDYILLSPALFALVNSGRIHRLGVWGGKNGKLFPHYPEITVEAEAASDHAALVADINL